MIEGSLEHPQMSSKSIIDALVFMVAGGNDECQVIPIDIGLSTDPSPE